MSDEAATTVEDEETILRVDTGADKDDEEEIPSVKVEIGGEKYTAYPPKQAVYFRFAGLEDFDGSIRELDQITYDFLNSCFSQVEAGDLKRRLKSHHDNLEVEDLYHMILLVVEHFEPYMSKQFEKMGVRMDKEAKKRMSKKAKGRMQRFR